MVSIPWLGHDERGGVPSQDRPDFTLPPHWRLDAIYATERPHHPRVSPQGATIAFVLSAAATSDVYVVSTSGGQATRLTTDRRLASYWEDSAPQWSPDGKRIACSSGGDVLVVPIGGGPPQRIENVSLGCWFDDERLVVVVERDRSTRLALVEVDDPWPRPFGPRNGDIGQPRATGEGRVLATYWPRSNFSESRIVVAAPGGEWESLVSVEDRRAVDSAIHDGEVAYVVEDGDWRAIYLTDLSGSSHGPLARAEADFGELAWSPDGSQVAAIRTARGRADLVTVGHDGQVDDIATGGFWQSPGWIGEQVVAIQEAHDIAPRLVLLGDDAKVLYDGAPAAVTAAPHRPFERITYTSDDDLEVEGFLFRPSDLSTPVPAVVYPHGGPTSVYGDEWDGHAQYFIDKGYAWLAINFRGSTTYGLDFERANHNVWGVSDTADCIAAGVYLQGLEWVDSDRIAIFGASYGSYMALASMVHPRNPFACGVAKYGDSDILTSWAQGDRAGGDDLERMMGHPSDNGPAYHAGSPIHSIEAIERPILVAHGERDERVHVKQAEELVEALKRLDKTYEYVTYPLEGHGFLRRESHIDFYKRLERFLDWYLI
jgi:dipeptidyl aminopeptidase/acylaminoacyl peptidase